MDYGGRAVRPGRVSVCVLWSCRIIEGCRGGIWIFLNSAASVQLFIESNYSVSMWHSSLRLNTLFYFEYFFVNFLVLM